MVDETTTKKGRDEAIAILGEEMVQQIERELAEQEFVEEIIKQEAPTTVPVVEPPVQLVVVPQEKSVPDPDRELVDDRISSLIEQHRTEEHERKSRLVGICVHCKDEVLDGQMWLDEKLIYDPQRIELRHGLIHRKCLLEAYRQLVVGLVHDIHSRESSYQNVIRMLAPKEDSNIE